jgi:hypothetical protein
MRLMFFGVKLTSKRFRFIIEIGERAGLSLIGYGGLSIYGAHDGYSNCGVVLLTFGSLIHSLYSSEAF